MGYNNGISPLHHSLRRFMSSAVPANMDGVMLPRDSHAILTKVAIDVFTDCINRGKSFQDALFAIYMTGAENAFSASKDDEA